MARQRYRSYRSSNYRSRGRGRKKRMNSRWAALLIIVIIAAVFILKQSNKGKDDDTIVNDSRTRLEEYLKSEIESDRPDTTGSQDDAENNTEVIEPIVTPANPREAIDYSPGTGGLTQVEADLLIKGAAADFEAGNIIAGRDKLNKVLLEMELSYEEQKIVKARLQELSETWLFSRDQFKDDILTGSYMVKSGDLLSEIGKQHKVPYDFLMTINGIDRPELLRAGRKIKIVNGPFRAEIHLSTFTLDIFLQEQYVKSYKIAIGKPGDETPTGKWCVRKGDKLIRPQWTDDETKKVYPPNDPENPIGDRWIGIMGLDANTKSKGGYALHGTIEPESIGTRASRGCVRLNNEDVVEVFDMLTPVHSIVEIFD